MQKAYSDIYGVGTGYLVGNYFKTINQLMVNWLTDSLPSVTGSTLNQLDALVEDSGALQLVIASTQLRIIFLGKYLNGFKQCLIHLQGHPMKQGTVAG